MTWIGRLKRFLFSRSMEQALLCDNLLQRLGKVEANSRESNHGRSQSGWKSSKLALVQDSLCHKPKSVSVKVHSVQELQHQPIVTKNSLKVSLSNNHKNKSHFRWQIIQLLTSLDPTISRTHLTLIR